MSSLDPHAPYVLDTRELGRRPGTSQRVHLRVPAPEGLQVGLTRVEAGLPVEVDVLLEAVMEGVLVTLQARVPFASECARCLDEVAGEVGVDAQELFAHARHDPDRDEGADPDTLLLDGDLLDLEPVLRDAVVLALPPTVLCDPDCPGLCPQCGARLADDPDHSHADPVDPRWSALGALAPSSGPGSVPEPAADPTPTTAVPEEH